MKNTSTNLISLAALVLASVVFAQSVMPTVNTDGTPIRPVSPRPSPADAKLWQSVHDYLDNPSPLAVLFRNPWKWLNSRTPKKP